MSDLYFIRIPDGPVKIGKSADVGRRLRHLQISCPYELALLGTVAGGGRYEAHFHHKLRHHHMRGEWFRWKGIVPRTVEAALDPDRWLAEIGLPAIECEDWFTNSPLYATADNAALATGRSFPPFQRNLV